MINLVIAAMAIEDACTLSVVLQRGTKRSEIDERLALYEQIRDERPQKLQQLTRESDQTFDRESYNSPLREYNIRSSVVYSGVN